MNMQNIQMLFLLFDTVIKLAPWRIVTETMQRIGYDMRESLVRSLGAVAVVGALLYVFPPASIVRAVLPAGCFGGAMVSHMRIGAPLWSHIPSGFWLGLMVWGGLWLCRRGLRALMPFRSRFA
jgi:DoxX-like family